MPAWPRSGRCSRATTPTWPPRSTRAEYDIDAGYGSGPQTYDSPLRLFPVEEPAVRALLGSLLRPAGSWTPPAAPAGTARGSRAEATTWSASMLAGHAGQGAGKAAAARFEQGDLTALPLPDASVDAACARWPWSHLPDLRPALAEFARVVRPGGRIVISDVHPFLGALGWQAQFRTAAGGTGFVGSTAICRRATPRPR